MKMALSESSLIASKFKGCMLGTLLGDCLGAPFEGEPRATKIVLQKYFDKLYGPYFSAPKKLYTDDTAMTRSVAKSLISEQGYNPTNMAKRFVKEYFLQPRRGYGAGVSRVFEKLRGSKFADIYLPAKEQFNGMGSFGNGGAMRVAPIALYYFEDKDGQKLMCDIARQATEITHSNKNGRNGAILQCMAVEQCLRLNPKETVDANAFIEGLQAKLQTVEKDEEELFEEEDHMPFFNALDIAKKLLDQPDITDDTVETELGNDISALRSVPTAIFCFLRAQKYAAMEGIQTDDPFRRTLQYAISLGGDTDTIACMSGALAGAFFGSEQINKSVLQHCEAYEEIADLGSQLFAKRYALSS